MDFYTHLHWHEHHQAHGEYSQHSKRLSCVPSKSAAHPTHPEVSRVLMPLRVDWFGLALNFIRKESYIDALCLASLPIIHVAGEAAVCSFPCWVYSVTGPHVISVSMIFIWEPLVWKKASYLWIDRLRSQLLSFASSDPGWVTSPAEWGHVLMCEDRSGWGEVLVSSAHPVSVSDESKGMQRAVCWLLGYLEAECPSGCSSQGGFARRQGGLHCSERVWGGHRMSNGMEHDGGTATRNPRGAAVASSAHRGPWKLRRARAGDSIARAQGLMKPCGLSCQSSEVERPS